MLGELRYDGMMMQLEPSVYSNSEQSRGFKGPTLAYRKIQDLDLDPSFRAYMRKPVFRSITRRLIGESVAVYRAMFLNKPAHGGSELRWHQDGTDWRNESSVWGLTIAPKVTIWTALDPATVENGCVEIVPGTHRDVVGEHPGSISDEAATEIVASRGSVFLELDPGEAVLLHNWTMHRSAVNQTDRPRRGFSVCYIDGSSRQLGSGRSFPLVFPDYVDVHGERPVV
jgi:ectoine hydroxylase-related dioxygenase (phytanoyl-CoA dioxygenase family)